MYWRWIQEGAEDVVRLVTSAPAPAPAPTEADTHLTPVLLQDTEFSAKVSEHLVDLLEAMAARGLPLAWVTTVKDAAALPVCLRQAGAFDHQVGGLHGCMGGGACAGDVSPWHPAMHGLSLNTAYQACMSRSTSHAG